MKSPKAKSLVFASAVLLASLAGATSAAADTGHATSVPGHANIEEDFALNGHTTKPITQKLIGRSPSHNADQKNTIFYNKEKSNGRLLVFFPGKGNHPEDYRSFLLRAAE